MTISWTDILADQVVKIVEGRGVTENDCYPLIRQLVGQIDAEYRPEPMAVLMNAKRRIYNLVEY